MIIYYHVVIILSVQKDKHECSSHRIIALDNLHENQIPREQSIRIEEQAPVYRNRMPRITHYNKWMSGRTAVTLHR
jgi:hypothetical protein